MLFSMVAAPVSIIGYIILMVLASAGFCSQCIISWESYMVYCGDVSSRSSIIFTSFRLSRDSSNLGLVLIIDQHGSRG